MRPRNELPFIVGELVVKMAPKSVFMEEVPEFKPFAPRLNELLKDNHFFYAENKGRIMRSRGNIYFV